MALGNLAGNMMNKVQIMEEGGIAPLVALIADGSLAAKEEAAVAIANLATNTDNQVEIANAGGIAPLVRLVQEHKVRGVGEASDAWSGVRVAAASHAHQSTRSHEFRGACTAYRHGCSQRV